MSSDVLFIEEFGNSFIRYTSVVYRLDVIVWFLVLSGIFVCLRIDELIDSNGHFKVKKVRLI